VQPPEVSGASDFGAQQLIATNPTPWREIHGTFFNL
jgi:hypothetical protein